MTMKRTGKLILILLVLGVGAGSVWSEDKPKEEKKKKSEVYSATAFGVAGAAAGQSVSLTIYIDDYTTDAEAHELAQTLKTGGSDAVLKAMDKIKPKKGRIAVVGRTGQEISIIRSRPAGKGQRRIFLVLDRPISFLELRQGTRSRDYEFGVIELLVDEKGKGSGTALVAAKIKFTKQDTLEIEHYGVDPVRLVNVYKF